MHFLERKYVDFDYDFTEICFQWPNQKYSSIGADNGMAPASPQLLSEPTMVSFPNAYVRHSASMN